MSRKTKSSTPVSEARFTPPALALAICRRIDDMRESARLPRPEVILEPSAGCGSFVAAARTIWPGAAIYAVEPLSQYREVLLATGADSVHVGALEDFGREIGPDLIIGNPPFTLAEAHVRLLRPMLPVTGTLAFLLRINFYGGRDRVSFWREHQEDCMLPIAPRPSFGKNEHGKKGTDGTEYATFVWGSLGPGVGGRCHRGPHIIPADGEVWGDAPDPLPAAAAIADPSTADFFVEPTVSASAVDFE